MGFKLRLGIVSLLFLLVFFPAGISAEDTVTGISKQLVCQCGCNMVLANCSHAECGSRESMTAFIQQEIDQGRSGPQIIQTMVARYGEQVLSAPTKRGFNLTAWILPFIALLGGAVVAYLGLRAWVRRGADYGAKVTSEVPVEDEKYRRRLDRELKEFNEGAFR